MAFKKLASFIALLLIMLSYLTPLTASAEQQNQGIATSALEWRMKWLTEAERNWLAKHPVLRHGMVSGQIHMPFEYVDQQGKLQGLTSDYLKIVSDKLGIEIHYTVKTVGFDELGVNLITDQIDLVTYLPKYPYLENQVHFTQPIIQMPLVLLGRENSAIVLSLDAIHNERIIVSYGSYAHELLTQNHPNIQLSFVSSTTEGLKALKDNSADIFLHNVFSIEYYQRKLGIFGLKVLATTQYNYEIMFAVKPSYSPLIPMLHKVIADIKSREKRLIFDKWINIQIERKIDLQFLLLISAIGLVIIFAVIAWYSFWNRRLTKEVSVRTLALQESSQELRNLARHMDKVREEEKAMLAREIHDELGHTLVALSMGIRRLSGVSNEVVHGQKLDELRTLVRSATATSKRIMSNLRPSILEDLGLVAAIEWLASEFESRSEVICHVYAIDLPVKLREEAAISLFRIVQESLTNISKHAQASVVKISIVINQQKLLLKIDDDGCGLQTGWQSKIATYGLQGMRERVLALGGMLNVSSENHQGVCLSVCIPLEGCIFPDEK